MMNSRVCSVLISFWLHLFFERFVDTAGERFPVPQGFLAYRTISSFQRYCTCPTSYSCCCCQSVVILYTKAEKNLCVNFTYQRNGLNVDVTLNSDTIRARTVTDYKPFKFCTKIPGCYFSSACVNVLELNEFSRSITMCLRLDIFSKKRLWQLNYDCISLSTELPMMPANGTMNATEETAGSTEMTTVTNDEMTSTMASSETTMAMTTTTMAMMTEGEGEETTTSGDVEVITTTAVMDID